MNLQYPNCRAMHVRAPVAAVRGSQHKRLVSYASVLPLTTIATPRSTRPTSRSSLKTEAKRRYQYNTDYPGLEGVAAAKKVPADENFSVTYIVERLLATSRIIWNGAASRIFVELFGRANDDLKDLEDYKRYFPPVKVRLPGGLRFTLPLPRTDRWLQLPDIHATYTEDDTFAEQRLIGVNPVMIRALAADDPRAALLEPFRLEDDLAKGFIYVADYTGRKVGDNPPDWLLPENIQGGTYIDGNTDTEKRKALPTPIAFFRWIPDVTSSSKPGKLAPVAIQLVEGGRVFTPRDAPMDWLFAKTATCIADANHHELATHLARCHLVTEAFGIATRRNFDDDHALSYLLRAHTRFLIANNELGRQTLINRGGVVEKLLAGTFEESIEITRLACATWDLIGNNFPNDIQSRGMDRLPHYPFRDDGQLLWDAILAFTTAYVAAAYPNPASITADAALQAWAAELADPSLGSVPGMPAAIQSREQLAEVLASLIFVSGPQHCAVNYTQHAFASYVPHMPLAARDNYRELAKRDARTPITEKDLVQMLPAQRNNRDQTETLWTLSAYRFDALGDYDAAFESLYNEDVEELLDAHPQGAGLKVAIEGFQQQLKVVEAQIDEANKKRRTPYEFLKPSKVLNSISI